MNKTIKWRDVYLYDPDGGKPDDDTRLELLAGYMDGDIPDYFLVDATDVDSKWNQNDGTVWDDFHHERRSLWDAGPSKNEIDWTGFPITK